MFRDVGNLSVGHFVHTLRRCYRGRGYVAVFRAYFDDGGTEGQTPIVSVAGYVATEHRWRVFERAWRNALKPYGFEWFHMSDFETRKPPFHELSNGDRKKLINSLIRLTRQYRAGGFRAALKSGAFAQVDQESDGLLTKDFGNAYAMCYVV